MNFEDFKNSYQKKSVIEYQNDITITPLLSICIQTYNQVKFIKECLDGILMQQTNFDFEILLGEDASIDGTREICMEYAKRHPDKIRLFLHNRENNISISGSPTGRFNFLYNLYSTKGKYIALCEGDDYWTDPLKLQKQVDFLEANPEYVICFTDTKIQIGGSLINNNLIVPKNYEAIETLASVGNYIHTPTVVFKNIVKEFPSQLYLSPIGDYFIYMLLAEKGKIHFINEYTTVYRKNVGTFSSLEDNIQYQKMTTCRAQLYDYFNNKNNIIITETLKSKVIQYFRDTDKIFNLNEIRIITKNEELTLAVLEYFYLYSKQKQYLNSISSWDLVKIFIQRLLKKNKD